MKRNRFLNPTKIVFYTHRFIVAFQFQNAIDTRPPLGRSNCTANTQMYAWIFFMLNAHFDTLDHRLPLAHTQFG